MMLLFTISETKSVNHWPTWLWCPLVVSIKLTLMSFWECVLEQQEKERELLHPQPGLGARKSQRMICVMAKDIADWDPEVYRKKKKENFLLCVTQAPVIKGCIAIKEPLVSSCIVAASSSIFLFFSEDQLLTSLDHWLVQTRAEGHAEATVILATMHFSPGGWAGLLGS